MAKYRVFLGAPTAFELIQSESQFESKNPSYHWQTVASIPNSTSVVGPSESHIYDNDNGIDADPQLLSLPFPPATLDAASHRISLIYKNVIFQDGDGEVAWGDEDKGLDRGNDDSRNDGSRNDFTRDNENDTAITWPPSPNPHPPSESLAPSSLDLHAHTHSLSHSLSYSYSYSHSHSCAYSDASSIARFPTFSFSLHALTRLSSLTHSPAPAPRVRKLSLVLALLEVEGPDAVTVRRGAGTGERVQLLRMVAGDEEGAMCKLTAWREVAERWAGLGAGTEVGVKRGDVVFIENVSASQEPGCTPTLTASPHLKSVLEICYRTMPYTERDKRLRPDLRLGKSDAAVGKVAAVAGWFERVAGLV